MRLEDPSEAKQIEKKREKAISRDPMEDLVPWIAMIYFVKKYVKQNYILFFLWQMRLVSGQ